MKTIRLKFIIFKALLYGFFFKVLLKKEKIKNHENFNKIIRDLNNDPILFIKYVSSKIIRGNKDDFKSVHELKSLFFKRKLILTCGYVTKFIIQLLKDNFNIKSRDVHFLTNNKLNGINDGHTILEINYLDQWIAIDPSLKYIFLKKNDKTVSAFDLIYNLNQIEFKRYDKLVIDNEIETKTNKNVYSFEKQFYSGRNVNEFKKRIFNSILIKKNGRFYTISERNKNLMKLYKGIKILSVEDFKREFYS